MLSRPSSPHCTMPSLSIIGPVPELGNTLHQLHTGRRRTRGSSLSNTVADAGGGARGFGARINAQIEFC